MGQISFENFLFRYKFPFGTNRFNLFMGEMFGRINNPKTPLQDCRELSVQCPACLNLGFSRMRRIARIFGLPRLSVYPLLLCS